MDPNEIPSIVIRSSQIWIRFVTIAVLYGIGLGTSARTTAQALNWEGQTGVFVTPLAYVTPSENGLGRPAVAYHYLNGGEVLGGFHQVSLTEGALGRVEFGYTRSLQQAGSTPVLSTLWGDGFNTFHGKANVLRENAAHRQWLPALSIGFVARTQVHNVTGALQNKDTNNADFYAVITKTVTQIRNLPFVLSFGFKETNAALLGLAGNAPGYTGRLFGTVAFAIGGPGRSTLMLASEVLQQPRHIEGLPNTAVLPTTITYAIRIVPSGTSPATRGWGEGQPKLNIDLGIAQVAGQIAPGVDLKARHQFALGISYGF